MGFSNTNVSVGNSSTLLAAANSDRKYLRLQNDSDEAIYISIGAAAVMNKGVRLTVPGAARATIYEISAMHGNLTTEAVYGICTSGSKNCLVLERSS